MEPEIQSLSEPLFLVGNRQAMSFANDKTFQLWNGFMQHRNEIKNRIGEDLYNVVIYPDNFDFHPQTEFEKWATVRVPDTTSTSEGMETLIIPEGLYAVFIYKGNNSEAAPFFKAIFMEWMPASKYVLDNRPHFEILGNKYKANDPNSEEEVWIPIKIKP